MAIDKVIGVDVTDASVILGISGLDKVNGFELESGGGPVLVASDDFSWAPPGFELLSDNANWTIPVGSFVTNGTGFYVVPFSAAATSFAYFDTVAASGNQRVEITLVGLAGAYVGPAARMQTDGDCYYVLTTGGITVLGKRTGGTDTNLQTNASDTLVAGDKVAIEVTGSGAATRLKLQVDTGGGWVDRWTNEDPGGTYLSTGRGGLAGYDTTNAGGDDWKWYNL